MTNIPDLTNASPGDLYEGPDGRLWEFRRSVSGGVVLHSRGGVQKSIMWLDLNDFREGEFEKFHFAKVDG